MLLTKEHYELMAHFETQVRKVARGRLDREAKQDWQRGIIYEDGNINQMFIMFRTGYMLGKSVRDED